jgi:hypothetical protein
MKTDRQIKLLLALIALALFINALNPWMQPVPAFAARSQADLPAMETYLRNMDAALNGSLEDIEADLSRLVALAEVQGSSQPACEWSLIDDRGTADIGRNGEVDLAPAWALVSQAGWTLKAVHGDEFIFERCG